jgi:hypothetical protein
MSKKLFLITAFFSLISVSIYSVQPVSKGERVFLHVANILNNKNATATQIRKAFRKLDTLGNTNHVNDLKRQLNGKLMSPYIYDSATDSSSSDSE